MSSGDVRVKGGSTSGLFLLCDVLQGIVPQKLCEGSVLTEQLLVGAHLGHPAIHQHHYVIHLRQEADAVGHQNTCLMGRNKRNVAMS